MENIAYNKISPKLKETVPVLKKGEKIEFEVLGIYYDKGLKRHIMPNSRRVISTDRIWDPFKQEYVDIAFVTGQKPGMTGKTEFTFGEIRFTRTNQGRISITGGNRSQERMLEYLWLTNLNEANREKDYHIKPDSGYKFKVVNPKESAKVKVEKDRKMRLAKDAVDAMSEQKLREVAKGLQLMSVNQFSNVEEIVSELYKFAETDPDLILRADDDVSLTLIAFVQDAAENGVVYFDGARSCWKWKETKEVICPGVPGKSPEVSFKDFLVSDAGSPVLETLKQYLGKGEQNSEEEDED